MAKISWLEKNTYLKINKFCINVCSFASTEKTWIKLGICLVYFILWFQIIDMENLSHEWLHDFMCII